MLVSSVPAEAWSASWARAASRLAGSEGLAEPGVERADDVGFAEINALGVVDVIGQGVFGGQAAAGLVVVPVAGHAPVAQPAEQDAAQGIGAGAAVGLVGGAAAAAGQDGLGLVELFFADDRRVCDLLGEQPLAGRFERIRAAWPSATLSTSRSTSSVRWRFHTR